MRIATWNVNSVRARRERLLAWLFRHSPDVLCLQELKTEEKGFPAADLASIGYRAVVHGQKAWNGVAIVARQPISEVERGFDDGGDESQARLVAVTVAGLRIVSAYFPNGQEPGSPKYDFKRDWLARLEGWLRPRLAAGEPLCLCGDFNIAPEARDLHDPAAWEGTVLYNPEMRAFVRRLHSLGLVDVFRQVEPGEGHYTWWDYRQLAFARNAGIRIDHIFAPEAVSRLVSGAFIDRDERRGESPSDHTPLVVDLDDRP